MRFQVFHCLSAGSYFQETGHHKEHSAFHLDTDELEIIGTDFKQFFQRIRAPKTLFGEETVGSLLAILLWYARELGLAPKYLSEISKSITGRPAGDWIDSYAVHELQKLLSDQRLTLTDIVDAISSSAKTGLACTPGSAYIVPTDQRTPSIPWHSTTS